MSTGVHKTFISAKHKWYHINFREIWNYRDLFKSIIKRDIIIVYKQTILGPLWFVIQPIATSLVYTLVFGTIAKLTPDGIPNFPFYFGGLVLWNFFAEVFIKTSDTFFMNQNVFGKVYFPRLIIPLSIIASAFIKFFVQFLLFAGICIYHYANTPQISANLHILLLPLLLLMMASLGSGIGMIFTSLTTKYRDLKFLLQFGVQLLMWLAPIAYPLSKAPIGMQFWLKLNPITHIVETFKYAFLNNGFFDWKWLFYSGLVSLTVYIFGLFVFNTTEKDFIDRI